MNSSGKHFLNRLLTVRNLTVFLLTALVGFGVWYLSDDWQRMYDSLLTFFEGVVVSNEPLAVLVFVLLTVLSAMLSFFSSTPLVPIANDLWGRPATFVLVMVSWVVGAIFAYWVGLYFSRFIRHFKIFRRIDAWRNQLEGRTEFWLVFLFRFAMPAEIASYTLGVLRYPFWSYFWITIVTDFPFAILAVYISSALVDQKPFLFIGLSSLGILIITLMAYFLYKRLRKLGGKVEELEQQEGEDLL
ncbi:MAG: hypothetical protein COU11_02175 [Candidatus Harrisonbacteria bacterium CG10_big_fil_rev_8_21_14_0_10_49_15]|uniref:TVP38/TMEM64 family membrane protein n=1 Tax=Candidatus Harrisonbacteria bacterium CG10_big_fil_rev_8_21_14_0_10_49_15 TaxID=1974587 RepID=A0A2H0UML8_9BACT|nr:MAG: hypothetical protein COU11_02175 [Candidatus Harrisonbacteria bacterium CG10_big_fil_rev_8_21_14_0_10_49_15]